MILKFPIKRKRKAVAMGFAELAQARARRQCNLLVLDELARARLFYPNARRMFHPSDIWSKNDVFHV